MSHVVQDGTPKRNHLWFKGVLSALKLLQFIPDRLTSTIVSVLL